MNVNQFRSLGKIGNNWLSALSQRHQFLIRAGDVSVISWKRPQISPCSMPGQYVPSISYRYQHSSSNDKRFLNIPNDDNDLAANRRRQAKQSDKLRSIVNNMGMALSQWNVRDSNSDSNNHQKKELKNRRRRASTSNETKQNMQMFGAEDLSPGSQYLYKHPKRISEQFDAFNHSSGMASRRRKMNQILKGGHSISARLIVKSMHAASDINVTKALSIFGPNSKMPAIKHMFGKTSLIVQLPSIMIAEEGREKIAKNDTRRAKSRSPLKKSSVNVSSGEAIEDFFHSKITQPQPRFVAVFRFGSVVFFNVSAKDAANILRAIKNLSTDPIPTPFERKERFEIAISPQMQEFAHVNADIAMVKELNINNVAIVSKIMAQTVAFDSYNDMVDELLATFASINSTVKKTGNFTAMERDTLFKVVAQNNSLLIDMVAKLGIKDKSDTAWDLSQYAGLYDGMRDEFEIEDRFDQIEFKVNLIQQNAKFFLEILHNQKSDTLEWIIIVLISFECVLMILEMSGMGKKLMEGFGYL